MVPSNDFTYACKGWGAGKNFIMEGDSVVF